jgi:hypothetical protein
MCKQPDSSVGIAVVRYSKGPGFEPELGCTVFSHCDILHRTSAQSHWIITRRVVLGQEKEIYVK